MGYLKVGSYLKDVVVNRRIILKWAVKKSAWLGVIWIISLGTGTEVAGCCDKGYELTGSIKCREFLD
jgi:hypothetical protein